MKHILLSIVLTLSVLAGFSQEPAPTSPTLLTTNQRYVKVTGGDTLIYTYKGALYGWHREIKYKDAALRATTITINGVTQSLATNRIWTIPATDTSSLSNRIDILQSDIAAIESELAAIDLDLDSKADKAITVSAGLGLSGGGDLSANRTISADTTVLRTVANSLSKAEAQTVINGLVPKTTTVNGHALSSNVTVTKSDVGLGNVPNVDATNATNITSGTLADARLSSNVTLQGNTFNGSNQLLKLDAGGKVAIANLPSTLMIYIGVWDLSTNTPTLSDGTSTAGYVYKVTGAPTTTNFNFGSGNIALTNGDYVIYNNAGVWEKSDGTDAVTSVNGQQGVVSLTTSDITEGSNLYYTEGRVSANTDVAANTAVRHSVVTLGTANGLSLSTQQLSLGLASTSTTGALSSTDWNTFNSKQPAGNYLPLEAGQFNKLTGGLYMNNNLYIYGRNVGNTANLRLFGLSDTDQLWLDPDGIGVNFGWNANFNGPISGSSAGFSGNVTAPNFIGNASTATSATSFGGWTGNFAGLGSAPEYFVGAEGGVVRAYSAAQYQTALNLGSAAYLTASGGHNSSLTVVQRDESGKTGLEDLYLGSGYNDWLSTILTGKASTASLDNYLLKTGGTLSGSVTIDKSLDGEVSHNIINSNTGGGAYSFSQLTNGTSSFQMFHFGTNFTTSGNFIQNGSLLNANGVGGLTIATPNGTTKIVSSTVLTSFPSITAATAGRVLFSTTAGQLTDDADLTFDGTNLTVADATASGHAVNKGQLDLKATGAASSTDNAIARYDGTTGKIIQNSGVIIDDSGNLTSSQTIQGQFVTATNQVTATTGSFGNLITGGMRVAATGGSVTPHTLTNNDYYHEISISPGTVNLPSVTDNGGRMFVIKAAVSNAFTVSIVPNGSNTINGASSYTLTGQDVITIISLAGSTDWRIISKYTP